MIQVLPDENERAGGYGFVVFPDNGIDPENPLTIEIFETFGGRWLGRSASDGSRMSIGDANWQTDPHAFGPYPIKVENGSVSVRIGPEIINKVPEYTHCRIKVAGLSADLIWPDNVIPRAGAAALGGLKTIARPMAVEAPTTQPAQPIDQAPTLDMQPADTPPISSAPVAKKNYWPILVLLSLLGVVVITALFFFKNDAREMSDPVDAPETMTVAAAPSQQDPAPTELVMPAVTSEVGQPAQDACDLGFLTQSANGIGALYPLLEACSAQLSADEVFDILETARAAGDPDALLRFGYLYDPMIDDPVLEAELALGAPANLPQAVEYYSQAKAKGSTDANAVLREACERLDDDASTLSQGAYNDFCR